MIELNNHNGPEAGPSNWWEEEPEAQQRSRASSASRGAESIDLTAERHQAENEDGEESARDEELESLERTLMVAKPSIPPPAMSRSNSSSNPTQSRPSIARNISTLRPTPAAASALHTSASELFNISALPPLTRHTTYSSLPPSPRGLDFAARGLGIKDLDAVLGRLGGGEPEKEDDEFWPARSRRPTLEGRSEEEEDGERDRGRSPSPEGEDAEARVREGGGGGGPTLGLWDLLRDEAGVEEWEEWVVDGKWERIANFLAVPLAVERVTLFGSLLCLDTFLYNFTILPLRAFFACYSLASTLARRRTLPQLPPAHIHSILRMLLLFIPTVILLLATDTSKMYHSVRGQDTIKLYVIFNALEIADRLCCAFGQDVLDTLFARETLAPTNRKRGKGRKRQQARPVFFFMLSLGYVLAHTLIYFYMLVSLNVAINSYDYTLLSLLISNQFVEIKGSVFKKFEKENLFQIMCADIVERFQLSLMLCVIALRNMIEMAGSDIAFLPKSFIRGKSLVDSILSPVLFVITSEMLVDWLKHAFITKFNHVRASVYGRFADVLAKDVLLAGSLTGRRSKNSRHHPVLLDQSPLVARRLGFASIPLACLVIRIGAQAIGMLTMSSHHGDGESIGLGSAGVAWLVAKWSVILGVGLCAWGCLVALKVLLGLSLLSYAAIRQSGMEAREAEDVVNDFGRSAVAESKEEAEYNKQTAAYLSQPADDLPEYTSPTSATSPSTPFPPRVPDNARRADTDAASPYHTASAKPTDEKAKKGKKSWKLEEVDRWTMVKRIW